MNNQSSVSGMIYAPSLDNIVYPPHKLSEWKVEEVYVEGADANNKIELQRLGLGSALMAVRTGMVHPQIKPEDIVVKKISVKKSMADHRWEVFVEFENKEIDEYLSLDRFGLFVDDVEGTMTRSFLNDPVETIISSQASFADDLLVYFTELDELAATELPFNQFQHDAITNYEREHNIKINRSSIRSLALAASVQGQYSGTYENLGDYLKGEHSQRKVITISKYI